MLHSIHSALSKHLNIFSATIAMTLDECVVLEESVFYNSKDVDEALVERIRALLDGYACFNEQAMTPPFPPPRPHPCKRYDHFRRKVPPGGRTNAHTSHPPRRVQQPERQLTALLNKLSDSNFEKLSKSVLEAGCSTEYIVAAILTKCQKQPCFMELYMRLLERVFQHTTAELQGVVKECVTKFLDSSIEHCAKDISFTLNNESYDDFCNNISLKANTLGKHKTVLALLFSDDEALVESSVMKAHNYFDALFNMAKVMGEKGEKNTDMHELVLEMVLDCSRCGQDDWNAQMRAYFTNPTNTRAYSAKARFKVMDVFD
jgi:hypothetical protein